ncbi:MAG TPA: PRC-barrel domain-containing protein [Xanthobacteraceae bacterium]
MRCSGRRRIAAPVLALAVAMSLATSAHAAMVLTGNRSVVLAQAMVPPSGMMDAQRPMPMNERYRKRFPQPARVGDLIGLPVLDLNSSTLGYVRQVVRTPAGSIEFIVGYSRWWGWFGRPVAVPLEVLGLEGRQLVSLDMAPGEYAAAPTWHDGGAAPLAADATIRVALARG